MLHKTRSTLPLTHTWYILPENDDWSASLTETSWKKILGQHKDLNPQPSNSDHQAWGLTFLTAFRVFPTNQGPQKGGKWPLEDRPNISVASNQPLQQLELNQSVCILMSSRPAAWLTSFRKRCLASKYNSYSSPQSSYLQSSVITVGQIFLPPMLVI